MNDLLREAYNFFYLQRVLHKEPVLTNLLLNLYGIYYYEIIFPSKSLMCRSRERIDNFDKTENIKDYLIVYKVLGDKLNILCDADFRNSEGELLKINSLSSLVDRVTTFIGKEDKISLHLLKILEVRLDEQGRSRAKFEYIGEKKIK